MKNVISMKKNYTNPLPNHMYQLSFDVQNYYNMQRKKKMPPKPRNTLTSSQFNTTTTWSQESLKSMLVFAKNYGKTTQSPSPSSSSYRKSNVT